MAAGRVLIIDDEEAIREVVGLALSLEGYEVEAASHGAHALEIVDDFQPNLILLDLRMPVMDGWEFLRAYRAGSNHHAAVVGFTAARQPVESSEEHSDMHLDGVLPKPFELDDLIQIVRHYTS